MCRSNENIRKTILKYFQEPHYNLSNWYVFFYILNPSKPEYI